MEELKQSSPGAREIEIDRHEHVVKRYYVERPITKNDNLFEQTARLIVTLLHHEHGTKNLVERVDSSVITSWSSVLVTTLTSVAVGISTTGVRPRSPNLRSREELCP